MKVWAQRQHVKITNTMMAMISKKVQGMESIVMIKRPTYSSTASSWQLSAVLKKTETTYQLNPSSPVNQTAFNSNAQNMSPGKMQMHTTFSKQSRTYTPTLLPWSMSQVVRVSFAGLSQSSSSVMVKIKITIVQSPPPIAQAGNTMFAT